MVKKQIDNSSIRRFKKLVRDIVLSFRTKGFSATVKTYKKQIMLFIGVLLVIIGVIALTVTGMRLSSGQASDFQGEDTTMSTVTYIPKEIAFTMDEESGEIVKDTHGDIVIDRIGYVDNMNGDKSFADDNADVYVHYTFTFDSDSESFDGEVPSVAAIGVKDGVVETIAGNNVVNSESGWTSLTKDTVETGKTYDAYASFDTDGYDSFYFQFVNADGNITVFNVTG